MRFILVALLATGAVACRLAARPADQAPAESVGAPITRAPLADSLTPRQRCVIGIFEKKQLPGAACMIECIKEGSGVDIGGGCWHICYAYTAVPMPNPARFDHCPDAGPMPVSPRPVVKCSAAPGRREVRVRLVDATSSRPLRGGMIFRPDHRTVVVNADSLGLVTMSVDDTLPMRVYGRVSGYAYAMDTIVVRENEFCDVLMRLVSARGHGF